MNTTEVYLGNRGSGLANLALVIGPSTLQQNQIVSTHPDGWAYQGMDNPG